MKSIHVDDATHRRLKALAHAHDVPVRTEVAEALEHWTAYHSVIRRLRGRPALRRQIIEYVDAQIDWVDDPPTRLGPD